MTNLISLVLMMKDEAASISQTIRSASEAVDRVDLLDTGSTDETIAIAQRTCNAVGLPLSVVQEPFVNFSVSRNRSLELAKPHAVFGLQLSGDETLHGGKSLREFCKKRRDDSGPGQNLFLVCVDAGDGNLHSTRLVRLSSDWRWKGSIHEFMESPSQDHVREMVSRGGASIHYKDTDLEKKRRRLYRDLELLQQDLKQDPLDPRPYFYIAQTLGGLGFYEDAIHYYLKRAEFSGWEEERYLALHRAGLYAWHTKRPWPEVQDILLRASAARPSRAESLVSLAQFCWERKDYASCFLFARRAAEIPYPTTDCFGVEPDAYEVRALNFVHLCGLMLGEIEADAGEKATRILMERAPEEPAFAHNLKRYEEIKLQGLEANPPPNGRNQYPQ